MFSASRAKATDQELKSAYRSRRSSIILPQPGDHTAEDKFSRPVSYQVLSDPDNAPYSIATAMPAWAQGFQGNPFAGAWTSAISRRPVRQMFSMGGASSGLLARIAAMTALRPGHRLEDAVFAFRRK